MTNAEKMILENQVKIMTALAVLLTRGWSGNQGQGEQLLTAAERVNEILRGSKYEDRP